MFFGTFLLPYLLLIAYVCWRVWGLLESALQKTLVTMLLVALALAFPAAEMLSHSSYGPASRPVQIFGYLALPLLLYLFLFLLFLDLVKGINRMLKIVPPETFKTVRGRRIVLVLTLVVPSITVVAGRVNFATITVNEYTIEIPRRSSALREMRIAVASDFHLKELTDASFPGQFVDRVNSLEADLLLIPGDLLEGDRQDGQLAEVERQFRRIRTRYGVFASPGNHESHGRRTRDAFFKASNIALLEDSVVVIGEAVTVVGRRDSRAEGRKPVGELMLLAADTLPSIVLDHKPTDLEAIGATRADILVSGHTHYGQLWPLNYITEMVYDVSWGYRRIRNTHLFVTSGIQVWGPPVRTAGDSEIMLITARLE